MQSLSSQKAVTVNTEETWTNKEENMEGGGGEVLLMQKNWKMRVKKGDRQKKIHESLPLIHKLGCSPDLNSHRFREAFMCACSCIYSL